MVTSEQKCLDAFYDRLGTCTVQPSTERAVSGQIACKIFTPDMLLQQDQPDARMPAAARLIPIPAGSVKSSMATDQFQHMGWKHEQANNAKCSSMHKHSASS